MNIPWVGHFVALFFLVPVLSAQAATLYMDPGRVEISRGDVITVSVRLDTDENECVNTIDAVLTYTENISPIDTSRGASIFSLWVEDPVIDTANRTITFAAGIPNGYCGRITGDPRLTNNVIDLVFTSPGMQVGATESGNVATVEFAPETQVLLNDGFGTQANLNTFGSEVLLNSQMGGRLNEWVDQVESDNRPPQEFSITLERSSNAFANKHFIVFNTTDKQSGIDYYEVIEEPLSESKFFNWGAADAPWVRAQSPYVLEDQRLNSTIRVRAYDKAGNEYIATLVPDESVRSLSVEQQIMVALVGTAIFLLVVAGIVFFVLMRRRKERQQDDEYEEEYEYEEYEEEYDVDYEEEYDDDQK